MIAGLDGGLRNTGLVVLNNRLEVCSLNLIQVEPSPAKRLVDIETAVSSALLSYHPDIEVFIEGYAYGATYQRESLAELGGVLRRFFYLQSITYWVVPPRTLKQFVTGSGTAGKNYMKKCTKEKWNYVFKSDDVCDAYGLARLGVYVRSYLNGQVLSETDHEASVVAEIANNIGHYQNANTSRRPKRSKSRISATYKEVDNTRSKRSSKNF